MLVFGNEMGLVELTKAVLEDEAGLEGDSADEGDHFGGSVVDVHAVETAGVEEADGDGEAGAHEHWVVAYFS